MSQITVLIENMVEKTEKAGKWPKTYLFISNYREEVVKSTLCGDVTETLLQLLFEGAKPGEVFKPFFAQGEFVHKNIVVKCIVLYSTYNISCIYKTYGIYMPACTSVHSLLALSPAQLILQ